MKNFKVIASRILLVILTVLLLSIRLLSQLSYETHAVEAFFDTDNEYVSLIAYKLPFRGKNYKFYGTLNYHIYGRAYAAGKVHNSVVEAFHLTEKDCKDVNFKILNCSRRRNGKIILHHQNKNGHFADFMTPLLNKGKPVKFYFRTGLFRKFSRFDKTGRMKINNKIEIDFESMARFIINLDKAAQMYGLRIKRIIFNRFLLDELYACSSGAELKSKDIYFAKYLSERVNKRYDDLYYVEFAKIK